MRAGQRARLESAMAMEKPAMEKRPVKRTAMLASPHLTSALSASILVATWLGLASISGAAGASSRKWPCSGAGSRPCS
jgi:hypothetical protein